MRDVRTASDRKGRRLLATSMFAVALIFGGPTPEAIEALQRMARRTYAVAHADITDDDLGITSAVLGIPIIRLASAAHGVRRPSPLRRWRHRPG